MTMKRIGLIGGMSWESSAEYYRLVNEVVKEKLGGLHSADCVMISVDFDEIEVLQREARWTEAADRMVAAERALEAAGADLVLLCTNTMHKVAAAIQAGISVPFIHIADPTAAAIKAAGLDTIGLLGTRFTMEEDFYTGRLVEEHGLRVILPSAADRTIVHRVIYEELVLGILRDESRAQYVRIMRDLVERGAQGIILGCTEIGLLVSAPDSTVPLFDTTRLHALAGVEAALL
jgi:aspartate racemase